MSSATKQRIMDKAIEMFNERGASNVSTVQLANELKMSPGNLYYYFDNKEHLIRTIWLDMLAPKIGELFFEDELKEKIDGLMTLFLHLAHFTYEFRFFYLELPTILQNDPKIKKIYVERCSMLMNRMHVVVQGWIDNGIMTNVTPLGKKLLIQNVWILSQTAITYLNTLDSSVSGEEIRNGISHRLYGILYPYFSQESHNRMVQLFQDNGFPLPLLEA